MDSVNCVVLSEKCQGCEKLDDTYNEEAVQVLAMSNGSVSLEPITPVPDREIADSPYDCNTPLTEVKRPTKAPCFGVETAQQEGSVACVDDGDLCSKTARKEEPVACGVDDSSPRTPNDVVFDPFAPGPDNMVMAPLCKKYVDQMRTCVARRLKFESPCNIIDKTCANEAELISDEEMFESVYNNLLEAIVSKQTEGLLAETSNIEWNSDFCKTPPAPRLNGIAETCPGAPVKPSAKSRNIDLRLCRKLEF